MTRTDQERQPVRDLPRYHCLRCGPKYRDQGYFWVPRSIGRPAECPRCKSRLWDVPRKETKPAR